MRKVFRITGESVLILIIALVLFSFPPSPVKAESPPLDLEISAGGAISWSVTGIQPGDSGTESVELRNTGTRDGFVNIWVDDIISNEGENPESETGNTAEPGEFADHLLLNLTAKALNTSLDLPVVINELPQSASSYEYIEIIPLKTGDSTDLYWRWELPLQTGNELQGDNITFTINYMLREMTITDLTGVVDEEGVFKKDIIIRTDNTLGTLTINKDTKGHTGEGNLLTEIWLIDIDRESPPPVINEKAVVGLQYEAGPEGTIFDEPVTITLTFKLEDIPQGYSTSDLVIAVWDKYLHEWVPLENCVVDTVHNTISTQVTHFSRYTILSPPVSPPPSVIYVPRKPSEITEEEAKEEEEPEASNILELRILDRELDIEIGEDGVLNEPLWISDISGNFIISIESGASLTGSGGTPLSRIELRTVDRQIQIPDNTVILSPLYELTGYDYDMNITEINFMPPATLTIGYNPQDIPENTFLPFVANYSDDYGLVCLQPPSDYIEEIGKAQALIDHASLFFVAAELAPPPPPLPALFIASGLSISPKRVDMGKPITISVTITNEGAVAGTYELHLIVDGIVRSIEEVTLTGKSSQTLTFEVSNLAPGTHHVKVAGLAGEFSVVRIDVLPEESGVNWFLIDGSVAASLIIATLALYYITRKSRQIRPV